MEWVKVGVDQAQVFNRHIFSIMVLVIMAVMADSDSDQLMKSSGKKNNWIELKFFMMCILR